MKLNLTCTDAMTPDVGACAGRAWRTLALRLAAFWKPGAKLSSGAMPTQCVHEAGRKFLMSFKKKKKPLPDVGPSYDDGKLSFSGREEMDDLTENEQRMLTFSENVANKIKLVIGQAYCDSPALQSTEL